ncbi:hypothetical protein HRbin36_02489 [bacterium HR36]|nr:hypothetical protein HRbin36_02489 [bacterium HR36]
MYGLGMATNILIIPTVGETVFGCDSHAGQTIELSAFIAAGILAEDKLVTNGAVPDAANTFLGEAKARGPAATDWDLPNLSDAGDVGQKCNLAAIRREGRRRGHLDIEETFDSKMGWIHQGPP